MAIIKIQGTNETIEAQNEVAAFLEQQEVVYEHWDINKLPEHLREKLRARLAGRAAPRAGPPR